MSSGLTFGTTSAPNNITTYLDSVFSTSIANYSKSLKDNIGASNAFLYDMLKSDLYESADGGTYITEQLMYALSPMDSYNGYDELSTATTDGITQAQFDWRQMASPISYNMKEVAMNQHKIIDLVDARISQAELGIQEGWAQAFWWGNAVNGGNLYSPKVSAANQSLSVDPVGLLVCPTPTISLQVGGLDQSLNTWWQNKIFTSAATTYSGFIYEIEQMYNTTSLGTGGPPSHILMDQVTYQNWIHAYFSIYKAQADALDMEYPFVGKRFLNAKVIMDDKVPDFYSNVAPTQSGGVVTTTSLTYGSAVYLNQKFFKVRYWPQRDFELLRDENGKAFVKPINGDSRIGHIGWMGNLTCSNRRKQGMIVKFARSYSS
jgi:hypothetical protein